MHKNSDRRIRRYPNILRLDESHPFKRCNIPTSIPINFPLSLVFLFLVSPNVFRQRSFPGERKKRYGTADKISMERERERPSAAH